MQAAVVGVRREVRRLPGIRPAAGPRAKYWALWNQRAERLARWTYQLEQLPAVFDEFCRRIGVPADRSVLEKTSTKVNSRRGGTLLRQVQRVFDKFLLAPRTKLLDFLYSDKASYVQTPFTWDELEKQVPGWSERIKAQARRYGYTEADDVKAANAKPSTGG